MNVRIMGAVVVAAFCAATLPGQDATALVCNPDKSGTPAAKVQSYVTIVGASQGQFVGDSASAAHGGSIEGLAYYHQVATTDKGREMGPATITKALGGASPQIATAWSTHEVLEVSIAFVRTDEEGAEEVYYTVNLHDASVSSIVKRDDCHDGTVEDVSFNFSMMDVATSAQTSAHIAR